MSFLDISRKSLTSGYQDTLCLSKEECKVLLPVFEKALKEVEKQYNKYLDIHESGEATEKQIDLKFKYSEQREYLNGIISNIGDLIK